MQVAPAGDLQPVDRHRGEQERRGVDVEGEVDRAGPEVVEAGAEGCRDHAQPGEDDGGDRRGAVGGDEGELVGALEPLRTDHVRDRGLLGRDPEQADRLDEEGRHEQPDQGGVAVRDGADDGNRQEESEAQQVADHHRPATVPAIGERPGQRAEQQRRQEPEDQHAAGGVRLALEGVDELRSQRGGGQEAQPVAEAGQHERCVQPPERPDAQDRTWPSAGHGDGLGARCAHAVEITGPQCRRP